MNYLPEAVAALRVINSVVIILPHGDKVGVGVGLAITLCEAVQVCRKRPHHPQYEETYTCSDHAIESEGLCRARSQGFIPGRVRRRYSQVHRCRAHPKRLGQPGLTDSVRSS
jgi:hypothetical protein